MSTTPGTPRLSALEAIVFDFYGTLAEARGFGWQAAIEELLGALAMDLDEAEFAAAYRRQIERYLAAVDEADGEQHNTVWVARALTELGYPASPVDPRVVAAVDAYFARYAKELICYPEVVPTLTALRRRYHLGLVSNFTDPRPVRTTLRAAGLEHFFHTFLISAEIGMRKPHRGIFARAIAELGAVPGRTLYVGDDPYDDVAGAVEAGLRTAWVRRSHRPMLQRERSIDPATVDPDVTIVTLDELLPILLG